ncbi:MAG: T9SS type A sorting domain-containing protein [Bacteroidota bacterium]
MKLLSTIFLSLFLVPFVFAQSPCEPDPMFTDTLGVFPPPIDTTVENPSEGIDVIACIGKPYDFTFTIAIGDSLRIQTFVLAVDSITMSPDTAVMGLPAGLTYDCGFPDCTFLRDTTSCISISGVPDESNTPGEYLLTIEGSFHSGFLTQPTTIPGEFFPGFYTLKLEAADSEVCATSNTNKIVTPQLEMSISPNPTSSFARLKVEVPESDVYQYRIFNMLGREVFNAPIRLNVGTSEHEFDFGFLPNGLYLYSLSNENMQLTRRLIIRK